MPADNNSNLPYPVSSEYAVFAKVSNANIVYSKLHVDDENTNNNGWYWYGASSIIRDRISIIVKDQDLDTYYHILK